MAYSRFCSINVCICCLFVVFALDLVIPPNIFGGKDGFAKRHGIETSCHFLTPSWELIRKSVPIPDWCFGNNIGTGEVTKLMTFPTLIRQT